MLLEIKTMWLRAFETRIPPMFATPKRSQMVRLPITPPICIIRALVLFDLRAHGIGLCHGRTLENPNSEMEKGIGVTKKKNGAVKPVTANLVLRASMCLGQASA